HSGFAIALGGVGAFDKAGRPAALWAGVTPHDALKALHNKIDAALRRIGIAPDRRAFFPHVTLARLNRSTGPIDGFLAAHAGLASAPFAIDEFRLYESTLGGEGAIYTTVERFALG
ncbi:MAG: RNA 2',3'-cyclic phosphodiesterase, partial [Sphingomonadaceae bacterium]|nr:RNA 2',3'-cyclic phosphodiesterase [Sphingomonadaceae bacterium]